MSTAASLLLLALPQASLPWPAPAPLPKKHLTLGITAWDYSNKPWDDERDFRRSYRPPTLRRLGIRHRRPYQLRHSNASMRLMTGQLTGYAAG